MNSPSIDVDSFFKAIKKSKENSFMTRVNKEEEVKYVLHNRDRFIAALTDLDKILSTLPEDATLLDIGTSPITFIIKKRYPKLNITTTDITYNLAERARKAAINFFITDLNLTNKLPRKQKYDVIIFLEVLEHLKPQSHRPVLDWICEIMSKNGVCLLQTPNNKSLKSYLTSSLGRKRMDKVTDHPEFSNEFAHLKEYSLEELKSTLEKNQSIKISRAYYSMYFDTIGSTSAYRFPSALTKFILIILTTITWFIPSLRRGIQVILIKNEVSVSNLGTNSSAYQKLDDRTFPYHYEKKFTLLENRIISSGIQEIIKIANNYLNQRLNGLKVLDLGSGRGEYTREMAKFFGKVVGIEPYKDVYKFCLQHTNKKYKNLYFLNTRIEDFKSKEKFDLIVMLTVFEHMSNPKKAFDKIFKLLKKGGVIYLTTPNKYWIFEQHYGLPFLSWLPVPIANTYLKLFRGLESYEDSSYAQGFPGMKNFFNQFGYRYEFVIPKKASIPFIGCGKKDIPYSFIRKLGIKLITINPFFWNFSKGFILVIKNEKIH